MTRVTFVLPLYNGGATLPGCLDHLLAQRLSDWECVAVNDASPDDSATVFERYAHRDPRLQLLHHDANAGVAAARNTGLRVARGEFVHFLDQDDHIYPRAISRLVRSLRDHPRATAAYGDFEMVQTATGERRVAKTPRPQLDFADFARRSPFVPLAVLHRRSAVLDCGGFATGMDGCDDWDLWGRLTRAGGSMVHADVVVGQYRLTGGNASLAIQSVFASGMRVLKQLYEPDPRLATPEPRWAAGGLPENRDAALVGFLWSQVVKALLTRRLDLALELTSRFVDQCGDWPITLGSMRGLHDAAMDAAIFVAEEARFYLARFGAVFDDYLAALGDHLGRADFAAAARSALRTACIEALAEENKRLGALVQNYQNSRSYRLGRFLTRTAHWFLPA